MTKTYRRTIRPWLLVPATCALAGCISAPNVVLMDQKTALEQQAAGEFRALENDLQQAGISPKGEDITRSQLEGKDADPGRSSMGEIAQLYSEVQSDAGLVDRLLAAHCIGEALDGLLRQTPERCTEEVDTAEINRVVQRTNLHRRQIWKIVQKQKPDASEDEIRDAWRARHLKRVVCGGLIQVNAQTWEGKKC